MSAASDIQDILNVSAVKTPTTSKRTTSTRALMSATKELKSPLILNATGFFGNPDTVELDRGIKEKRKIYEQVHKWCWKKFTTSARDDNLVLHHWAPVEEGESATDELGTSAFEPLHKKYIKLFQYSNAEYESLIAILLNSEEYSMNHTNSDDTNAKSEYHDNYIWSRQETDQLFKLCKEYDLRFVIIHDRFQSYRPNGQIPTIEQMKNRYYTIARLLLETRARKKNQLDAIVDHPLMQCTYDYSHEAKRKAQSELIFNRDPKYIEKEEKIREQLKQIEDIKKKRIEEEKKQKQLQEKKEKEAKRQQQKLERERKRLEKQKLLEANAAVVVAAAVSIDNQLLSTDITETTSTSSASSRKPRRSSRNVTSSYIEQLNAPEAPKKLLNIDGIDEGMISSTSFSDDISTVEEMIKKARSGTHTRSELMYLCDSQEVSKRIDAILTEIGLLRPMPTLQVHQVLEEMKSKVATILNLEKKLAKLEKKSTPGKRSYSTMDEEFVPTDDGEYDEKRRNKAKNKKRKKI